MVVAGVTPVGKVKGIKNTVVAIEKIEKHHIFPKYLGGPKNGALVPLPKSYHQKITNEFRKLAPYGARAAEIKKDPKKVKQIMKKVYKKYPIKKYLRKR